MTFTGLLADVARIFEAIGAAVLIVGIVWSAVLASRAWHAAGGRRGYQVLREPFGGALLVGLEIRVLVLLADFGIRVPGEPMRIAAAIYAGDGALNVVAVGVIAFAAAVTGDNIGFAIGHFGGRRLALRWGRYIYLTAERLDRAES